MGKFVYFVYKFKISIHICDNSSSNNYDYDNEEKHCAPWSQNFHLHHLGLFIDKHSKELNLSTLFYGQL
jgi:hypothetical protein